MKNTKLLDVVFFLLFFHVLFHDMLCFISISMISKIVAK
jgi:hypothetical protein